MIGRTARTVSGSPPMNVLSFPSSASFGVLPSRRVGHPDAALRQVRADPLRRARIGGRRIDDDQARGRAGKHAVLAVDRGLDLDRGGQAQEDDIGGSRDVRRRLRFPRAARDEIVDRRAIAMPDDRQRVAVAEDVLGRAVPHQPDTDVSDPLLRHAVLLADQETFQG